MSKNLIPFTELTEEEQREIARKGGQASVKARREKKLFRETLESILSMPLKQGRPTDIESIRNFASLKGKNITVQEAVVIAQIQKAMKGDVKSAEFLRDTVGQVPSKEVNVTGAVPVVFSGEDKLVDDDGTDD